MAAARAGGGTPTPAAGHAAAGLLGPAARRGALPARLSCRTGPRGCPGRGEVEVGAASGAAAAGAAPPRARRPSAPAPPATTPRPSPHSLPEKANPAISSIMCRLHPGLPAFPDTNLAEKSL